MLVFVPDYNIVVGGSARWLRLPGLPAIHPAEIAKLAIVIYLAHWFAKRGTKVRGFWGGTVPFLIIIAPVVALVFKEPDLGTTTVIALTAFTMFFIAGANLFHLAAMGSAAFMAMIVVGLQRLPDGPHPDVARPVVRSARRRVPHGPGAAGAGRRRGPRARASARA